MKQDFLDTLNDQLSKNDIIWNKVRAVHTNIDETIAQIEYINNMQNEDLYEEMVTIVKNLSRKKAFLDSL